MTTLLITHDDGLNHRVPEGFPERTARLEAVSAALADLDLVREEAPLASDDQITRLHPKRYVERVRSGIPASGHTTLDPQTDAETFLSPGSGNAIWRAVGGAIRAVDAVLDGEAVNAFVAMRPPGHHAETELPMGFCIFGNVALAAKHALDRRGLSRVAIIDFDVHHGNGTEHLLENDPRVLFVSSHQSPLWPGTGAASHRGPHDTVINLPLPPGSGTDAWRAAYAPVWQRLRDHQPELILISAGFDAHQDDPLAQLMWSPSDYTEITQEICSIAQTLCAGRVVSVLEGGYDLDALAASSRAHVLELIKAAQS